MDSKKVYNIPLRGSEIGFIAQALSNSKLELNESNGRLLIFILDKLVNLVQKQDVPEKKVETKEEKK